MGQTLGLQVLKQIAYDMWAEEELQRILLLVYYFFFLT